MQNVQNNTRNAWNLIFTSLVVNIGFGLAAPLFAALGDNIDVGNLYFGKISSGFAIGILISAFMIARMASASIIPGMTDIIGRKKILVISLVVYGSSTFLMGFGRDFWSLFFLRLLEGAAVGAAFPVSEALLVDSVDPTERGAWMGKYFTSFNLGFVIGPGVGGVLFAIANGTEIFDLRFNGLGWSDTDSFILPFAFTGILGFLSSFLVYFLVHDIMVPQSQLSDAKLGELVKEIQVAKLYRIPFIYRLYSISAINGFAIGLIIPIFAFFSLNELQLEEEFIGVLFTIAGLVSLPVNYPAGKFSDRYDRLSIATVGMFLGSIAFMGMGLMTSLLLVILFFIVRFIAVQTFIPPYRAFQADIIPPPVRGTYFGRIQAFFNIGSTIGPLIGGVMYDSFSGRVIMILPGWNSFGGGIPFILAGVFAFCSTFLLLTIKKQYTPKKHLYPLPTTRLSSSDGTTPIGMSVME